MLFRSSGVFVIPTFAHLRYLLGTIRIPSTNITENLVKILLREGLSKKNVVETGFEPVTSSRGVNVRPNPRTRHEPDTGFFGLGLGLNGFGS